MSKTFGWLVELPSSCPALVLTPTASRSEVTPKDTTTFHGRNAQFSPTFTNRKLFFRSSQRPAVSLAIPLKLVCMEIQNNISKRIIYYNHLYAPQPLPVRPLHTHIKLPLAGRKKNDKTSPSPKSLCSLLL